MGLFAVFGPGKTNEALAILIGASLRVSDRRRTHHGERGRGVRSTRRTKEGRIVAMAGDGVNKTGARRANPRTWTMSRSSLTTRVF
jgi:hypothetical protein